MIIASLGVLGMLAVDLLVYVDAPRQVWQMMAYRGGFVLLTIFIIFAVDRTTRVRVFDRLVLGWTLVVIVALFLFDFSYPANYQTAVFDIIAIFAVYVLSPLTFQQNLFLAMCISAGTLLISFFLKDDIGRPR